MRINIYTHNCLKPLSCCFNMAFNVMSLSNLPDVIRKAVRLRLIISPMLCSRKRCSQLCYDIREFTDDANLFRTIQWFGVLAAFQCYFVWNQVKYARITTRHGSHFINTSLVPPLGLSTKCSNSFLGTQ